MGVQSEFSDCTTERIDAGGVRPEGYSPLVERRPSVVPITSLRPADSPRIAGEDASHVRFLAQSEQPLPPIVVHRSSRRVVDGMHRLRAAMLRGESEVPVVYCDGAADDLFVLAVRLNSTHGLPLSPADRTASAQRIMRSHPHYSDRAIASISGLSAKGVALLRRGAEESQAVSRVGQDGRCRPLDSASGRRRAAEAINATPNASLRKIASVARISVGTARDVRRRLERGEDPVPPGSLRRRRPERPSSFRPGRLQQQAARASNAQGPSNRTGAATPAGQSDLDESLRQLKTDPALRFSERGRLALRLFNTHLLPEDQWSELTRAIPAHCRLRAARVARVCAERWLRFAVELEDA